MNILPSFGAWGMTAVVFSISKSPVLTRIETTKSSVLFVSSAVLSYTRLEVLFQEQCCLWWSGSETSSDIGCCWVFASGAWSTFVLLVSSSLPLDDPKDSGLYWYHVHQWHDESEWLSMFQWLDGDQWRVVSLGGQYWNKWSLISSSVT